MSGPVLDFPSYVERTEPIRQQQNITLAFDVSNDDLLYKLNDMLEELEYIRDTWKDRSLSQNREAIQDQIRKMSRN